jgi:fructosamine-3-kinase
VAVTALRDALERRLGAAITSMTPVRGGDVAESHDVCLADGRRLFAKTHRRPPAGFFTTEANGLVWIAAARAVAVPEVVAVADAAPAGDDGDRDEPGFLVLEWVDTGWPNVATEADLGRGLAELHLAGAPHFGREDRRSTGSRGLPNEPCPTWATFYGTQRLLPLARLARDGRALGGAAIAGLERLAGRLDDVGGPTEPPARLHGDLWAGNRMVDRHGRSWLVDPAAHGGHREFDLAMMRLFGGFGEACFAAYDDRSPLADGWEERVALHQIAPLVVHAIKFGGSYRPAAEGAIARYA